ncbi:MAG: MotA/TolQ/ExbB proton channel family protein [Pseudomonadota bacterium]
MQDLLNAWIAIQDFMARGGNVLILIFLVIFVMWTLIIERLMYYRLRFGREAAQVIDAWESRHERRSWHAHQVRTAMLSQARTNLNANVAFIKTLVAVCPLCGLLGTVTGMIEVFDVMSLLGNGNARAMASGVSKATIPTMAGMVGALSGVFASSYVENRSNKLGGRLEDSLTMDH